MLVKDYKEQYNCAPYELADFAAGACDIEDAANVKAAALAFIEASWNFKQALENIDVELG